MITLYGDYPTLEGLTADLRRTLLAVGVMVVKEMTTGEGDELVGRLWVERIR